MIVKKHLNILKSLPYVQVELTLALCISTFVYIVYAIADVKRFFVPNLLPTVLGTALAIFLGFRNNAAYARWGEAAQAWFSIANHSRIFSRLTMTFVQSHNHMPSYNAEKASAFQREMIYRQIAWVHAVRMKLRDESDCKSLQPFLSDSDFQHIQGKQNKITAVTVLQGHRIYDAMRDGTLMGFDSFQLENALAQCAALATQLERIKEIPIPRQWSFFTRLFVWVFIVVIPFSYAQPLRASSRGWVVIPVTILLAFVFGIIERTGSVNEDPYDKILGVPLQSITIEIERDLRETLGESDIPEKEKVTANGYLF